METPLSNHALIDSFEKANSAILKIKECQSQSEVDALMRSLLPFFGLESYVFVSLKREDPTEESCRFFIGCAPEWCQMYNARKWFAIDPSIQYALRNTSPMLGSAIKPESPGQMEMLSTAVEYGFRSGMVIPVHGGVKARIGLLYLGSSRPAPKVEPQLLRSKNLLRAVALELYEWWNATIQAEAIYGLRFNELDLQLLRMEYEGLTTAEAARELGLSQSQINNRFRRINAKLKVGSKKFAVEKAIELGVLRV